VYFALLPQKLSREFFVVQNGVDWSVREHLMKYAKHSLRPPKAQKIVVHQGNFFAF
jgi:hypothetical protein